MDATTTTSRTAIRWTMAAALALVCALLIRGVLGGAPLESLHTLGFIAVALAAYAWVIYPVGTGALVNLAVLGCLLWVWAVRQAGMFALDVSALGILSAAAMAQRAQRARTFHRFQQTVEGLGDELIVKERAIAAVVQTRDALQRKLSRYTRLQTIAEELSNLTDLGAITALAVERAFSLIGKSEVCLLFLVDQERQELSLFASKRRESTSSIRAKHGDQFDRHVLRTHRPLLVNDVRRDFRFTVSVLPERQISSVIACPLMLGQRPSGVLRLDSPQSAAYNQDDLRFLDILLDLVSTAMTNARLFAQTQQLAVTDGLTGLSLRRPFLEQLARELARAVRSREPVSILMVDVDNFKSYNDSFGHTAGDLVLKGVADVLRAVAPPDGLSARHGGEEFVVLLPRMARHQASDVAEAIRRQVEQGVKVEGAASSGSPPRSGVERRYADAGLPGGRPKPGGKVTVSVGVASFPNDAQADLELIRIADQRLYQAKRNGRNLVCAA